MKTRLREFSPQPEGDRSCDSRNLLGGYWNTLAEESSWFSARLSLPLDDNDDDAADGGDDDPSCFMLCFSSRL